VSWLAPAGGDRGGQSCSASGTSIASAPPPSLRRADSAPLPTIAFIPEPPDRRRLHRREAVGISVLSDRFKTLPGWLEIS